MLLFIDGFDHYATADILKKWDANANSGATSIDTTAGRRGGGAISLGSYSYLSKFLTAYVNAIIVGFAVKSPGGSELCWFSDNSTAQLTFHHTADGRIQMYSGTTLVAQSLPGVAPLSSWFYFEAGGTFHATTGAFEVRINGNTVISITGADTIVSANAYATVFALGRNNNNAIAYYDDVYLCDTTGTVNNYFLGDCRVDAYYPTSEGAVQAWTPTPAGTHYSTVDESTPNSTDYVSSAVVGDKELFGFTDLVNTPLSIFGVQLNSAAFKTDAGFRYVKGLVRIGATDYASSPLDVTETMRYRMAVWDRNPATSAAWSAVAINAAEFGVETA